MSDDKRAAAEAYIREHPENTAYAEAFSKKYSHAPEAPLAGPPNTAAGMQNAPLPDMGPPRPPLPNEYHPPAAPKPGILGSIQDLLAAIPDSLPGGGTHMHTEPTVAEFRAATGSRLGEDSPEFRRFAERQWVGALAEAERQHHGVVRVDRAPSIGGVLAELKNGIPGALAGAAAGAADTATAGAATRLAPALAEKVGLLPKGSGRTLTDIMDSHPVASFAGSVAGGLTGVPGAILGRGAGPAAGAAAAAGATKLGQNASDEAAGALRGEQPDNGELTRKLITEPLGAAAGGAILGGLGGLAGKGQAANRGELSNPRSGALVRELEAGGGKQGVFGPKLSPGMKAIEAESRIPGPAGEARHMTDIAAEKAAGPLAKKIASTSQAMDDAWNGPMGFVPRYQEHVKEALPAKNVSSELSKIIEERTLTSPNKTSDLPWSPTPEFRKALNGFNEVSKPSAGTPTLVDGKSGRVVTVGQAQAEGYDVSGRPTDKVVITPRPLSPKQFETFMSGLTLAAKEDKAFPQEVLTRITAAARADRDKYPWPKALGPEPSATLDDGTTVRGFSAKHTLMHRELSDLERRMGDAGIPRARDIKPADIESATQRAVGSFGAEGQAPLTKALTELAGGDAAILGALRTTRGIQAARALAGKEDVTGAAVTKAGALQSARLRLDPILGGLASGLPRSAVPLTSGKPGSAARAIPGAVGPAASLTTKAFKDVIMGMLGQ